MTPQWRQTSLERCAEVAAAFEHSQFALWSSMWPLGHCAVTSLLLAPILRCADELGDWRVHVGLVAGDIRQALLRHAWCESTVGDIVDATYGQFDAGPALRVLPAYRAGDLGHYTSWRMTLDEEEAGRRSISSQRFKDGWTATSSVKVFFAMLEHGW